MAKTYFYWDPTEDNIVREYDEAGVVTAEYTTEPDLYGNVISQRRQGEYRQFHYDAQGSTLAVTDESQNVTDTIAYSAFGEVTERNGLSKIPFQYIGRLGYYNDGRTEGCQVRRRLLSTQEARWLSMDPLEFPVDGTFFLYAFNSPLIYADPTGLLTIEPAAGQSLKGGCDPRKPTEMSWNFLLDTVFNEKRGAPCNGWIVQKVDVYCAQGKCIKGTDRIPNEDEAACQDKRGIRKFCRCDVTERFEEFTYYEAWRIARPQRKSVEVLNLGSKYTDRASAPITANTCGTYLQKGEVRFYCESESGNLATNPKWRRGVVHNPAFCPTTSGRLLSTKDEPPFWKGKVTDGPAFRGFGVDWFCCGCGGLGKPDFERANAYPRPDE